jgi:predicted aminopeptidase
MNHLMVLSRSKKISQVLQSNTLSDIEKNRLILTQELLAFAESNLGLQTFGNYQSYSKLDGDYVTYLLTASKKWELELVTWWYPIVGRLPYRGFVSIDKARSEAEKYDSKEYETYIRGVSAYSTLGWFKDPVLSTMLRYSESEYVEIILHELIHANVFFKGEGDFNEQIATHLGVWGTKLYYESKGFSKESDIIKNIQTSLESKVQFSKFLKKENAELKNWYKSQSPKTRLDQEREKRFLELQARCENELKSYPTKIQVCRELNSNAKILSYGVYYGEIEAIEKFIQENRLDFKSFFKFLVTNSHDVEYLKKRLFY